MKWRAPRRNLAGQSDGRQRQATRRRCRARPNTRSPDEPPTRRTQSSFACRNSPRTLRAAIEDAAGLCRLGAATGNAASFSASAVASVTISMSYVRPPEEDRYARRADLMGADAAPKAARGGQTRDRCN